MYSTHRKESYHLGVKFLENFNYAGNVTDGRSKKEHLSMSIFLCEFKKPYYGSFLANYAQFQINYWFSLFLFNNLNRLSRQVQ